MGLASIRLNATPTVARVGELLFHIDTAFTRMIFVRLPQLCVVTVLGADATKIANNLCTANVVALETGKGCEAFVTEVRGKTLGHVCLYRTATGLQLIGAPGSDASSTASGDAAESKGQAEAIVAHFDRYTLREKSTPEDHSHQFVGFVLARELALRIVPDSGVLHSDTSSGELTTETIELNKQTAAPVTAQVYSVPWWTDGALLILVRTEDAEACSRLLIEQGGKPEQEAFFHRKRIEAAFPWYGVDLDATHLPQEADRDRVAISFTKGCYLGQETVARLDALGQVQKKLVRWSLQCDETPAPGLELRDSDRVVGRVTSICKDDSPGKYLAIGFARRSHFEPGSTATGTTAVGSLIQAIVVAPPTR
jgi:tRNA-modifying protein YgfZ